MDERQEDREEEEKRIAADRALIRRCHGPLDRHDDDDDDDYAPQTSDRKECVVVTQRHEPKTRCCSSTACVCTFVRVAPVLHLLRTGQPINNLLYDCTDTVIDGTMVEE